MKWREVNYFHHSDRKRQSGSDCGVLQTFDDAVPEVDRSSPLLDVKSMAAETAAKFFRIARGAADPPAKL
jgi:hypothetical protein